MSAFSKALTLMKDVRHLGVPVLGRFVNRTNSSGLQKVNTRYGDYWIRPSETDLNVIRQVYFQNSYDFSKFPQGERIRNHYNSLLEQRKVPVVIDAGANIGVASRYFSTVFPEARIFAIEPDPRTVAICRLNTEVASHVEVLEAAIGSEAGSVTVESFEGHAWATQTSRSDDGLGIVTVPDIVGRVARGELFMVKVDIEGFESDLFQANTSWIDDAFVVVVEPHDWMFPEKGTSQSLQNAMCSRGRDLIVSGENLIWVKR